MWQKVKKKILSDVAVNSAKLLSANVITQIIGLLVYPIITRLYTPEDFGLINLFLSIAGILTIISTAEFQYSIVLPKDDNKAIACLQIGICTTLFTTFFVCCTIPFSEYISEIFNTPDLAQWYWAIPILVFLSAIWNLLNYWCTRKKYYNEICQYQCTQSITNAGAKCGFGYIGLHNGGLILSAIISPFIALTTLSHQVFRKTKQNLFAIQKENIAIVAKEYVNFPKYSLPRALINYLSGNLPILLLTPFFGIAETGFLGLALTLGFRPINIISNSLYQVFFQKTTEMVQKKESILPFFIKFCKTVAIFTIPCFIATYILLPDIISFLLGSCWEETATLIQIMLIWFCLNSFISPICYIQDIFQRQKEYLFFEILLLLARLLAILIGILCNSFHTAIIAYSINSACILSLQLLWYFRIIYQYEQQCKIKHL